VVTHSVDPASSIPPNKKKYAQCADSNSKGTISFIIYKFSIEIKARRCIILYFIRSCQSFFTAKEKIRYFILNKRIAHALDRC